MLCQGPFPMPSHEARNASLVFPLGSTLPRHANVGDSRWGCHLPHHFRISHVSLFTPTVRGVPQPWGALQAGPRCTEAQKSFVRMLREAARGLCPAGAARSGAGTAAPPALSMCRPSRTETAPGPGKTRAQGAKREGRSEPCFF